MTKTEMLAAAASIGAAIKVSDVMREYRLAEAEYGKPAETLPWRTRVKTPRAMERITCEMVKEKIAEAGRRCGLVS